MEIGRKSRRLSALLALLLALTATSGIGRADEGEEPDLQIEVVGLEPGSQRNVVIRVTNVSEWWSDVTKATVETVAPSPGQRRVFDIPDMNTEAEAPLPHVYEFTYTLAADCDGHVVKASLSAGTNYDGDKEINLDDNVAELEVCPKRGGAAPATGPSPEPASKPSSKPAAPVDPAGYVEVRREGGGGPGVATEPVVFGPDQPETGDQQKVIEPALPRLPLIPEVMSSVAPPPSGRDARFEETRVLTLRPIKQLLRGARKDFRGGSTSCYTIEGPGGLRTYLTPKHRVGWSETEWFGSPCTAEVFQLAVEFDAAAVTSIPQRDITRAVLSFDEVEYPNLCTPMFPGTEDPDVSSNCWRSGGGKPEPKPNGCVIVRLPTADWRNGFGKSLIPFSGLQVPTVRQISRTEWDVTEPYRWRYQPAGRPLPTPGQPAPPAGFGFLLTGTADINGLEAEDSAACTSHVSNVQLTVTLTVPTPDDKPFEEPR